MIWQIIINKCVDYFSTEEKALNYIKTFGKIVKQNSINKNKQKFICDKNGILTKIELKKIEIK